MSIQAHFPINLLQGFVRLCTHFFIFLPDRFDVILCAEGSFVHLILFIVCETIACRKLKLDGPLVCGESMG